MFRNRLNILTKHKVSIICYFHNATFAQVLYGTDTERARWRVCVTYTNDNFGMAVGRMFVEKHFNEEAKKTVCFLMLICFIAYAWMIKRKILLTIILKSISLVTMMSFSLKLVDNKTENHRFLVLISFKNWKFHGTFLKA